MRSARQRIACCSFLTGSAAYTASKYQFVVTLLSNFILGRKFQAEALTPTKNELAAHPKLIRPAQSSRPGRTRSPRN